MNTHTFNSSLDGTGKVKWEPRPRDEVSPDRTPISVDDDVVFNNKSNGPLFLDFGVRTPFVRETPPRFVYHIEAGKSLTLTVVESARNDVFPFDCGIGDSNRRVIGLGESGDLIPVGP